MTDAQERALTVGSLFAGIGGFDLGLERAGMSVKWQVEIDPYCNRVLAKHWPTVPRYGDITTVDWSTVEPVDLLCGGFPCQDISLAGKGAGLSGERSGLWSEYVKAIDALKPKYILIENVAALRSRGLDQVLREIAALGFDAEWHCIPACAVGAPHRRDRVWIIAYAEGRVDGALQNPISQEGPCSSDELPRKFFGLSWEEADTKFHGMDDGVPSRVDRLRGLGNAIVPQIAEALGRMILRAEQEAI